MTNETNDLNNETNDLNIEKQIKELEYKQMFFLGDLTMRMEDKITDIEKKTSDRLRSLGQRIDHLAARVDNLLERSDKQKADAKESMKDRIFTHTRISSVIERFDEEISQLKAYADDVSKQAGDSVASIEHRLDQLEDATEETKEHRATLHRRIIANLEHRIEQLESAHPYAPPAPEAAVEETDGVLLLLDKIRELAQANGRAMKHADTLAKQIELLLEPVDDQLSIIRRLHARRTLDAYREFFLSEMG